VTEPLLTAIVSTYAAERFIEGCLDDLLAQTIAGAMEIIVVDAASPQNEGRIVSGYAARHPNIRYVRAPERETLYASWNRALGMAGGRYVTNANTDDRHAPDGLQTLVDALERDRGAALAYGDSVVTRVPNATFAQTPPACVYRWPEFDRRLLFQVAHCGPQPVWRRELHERYGLFDTEFVAAGDYEWWLRLAVHERFVHVPRLVGLYLADPGSLEHRHAARNWAESEKARSRHWRAEWGERPRPHGVFLRADWAVVARELLRGNAAPSRDLVAHAASLVRGALSRRRGEEQGSVDAHAERPRHGGSGNAVP
jgi:glycosyltransferase involved in cell wall biosynthesis